MATLVQDKLTEMDALRKLDKRTAAMQAETRVLNARLGELDGERSRAVWDSDPGLRHAFGNDFDVYADERRNIFAKDSLGNERADADLAVLQASCANASDDERHVLCESAMHTSAPLLRVFRQSADYCESVVRSKLAR